MIKQAVHVLNVLHVVRHVMGRVVADMVQETPDLKNIPGVHVQKDANLVSYENKHGM